MRSDMIIYFMVIPGAMIMLVNLCIFIAVVYTNATRKRPGASKQEAVSGCCLHYCLYLIDIVCLKLPHLDLILGQDLCFTKHIYTGSLKEISDSVGKSQKHATDQGVEPNLNPNRKPE